jgi:cysteine-rich repeat protein
MLAKGLFPVTLASVALVAISIGAAACNFPPLCGDGIEDPAEECDQGEDNSDTMPDACRLDCTLPSCGDNVMDTGEECDDGNTTEGDGCRANCTIPVCGDGIHDPLESEACDDGNTADGDGCSATCQVEGGDFGLIAAYATPQVNIIGGVRPRLDENSQIDVVVQATDTMSEIRAVIQNCDLFPSSLCDPIVEAVPIRTRWSLRLPELTGGPEPDGKRYEVLVSAYAQASAESASATIELDVYQPDPGLDVVCTKRYESGSLYVSFTLVDNGNLPPPYTLADMYDARFLIYQEGEETGFALDETDSSRSDFILMQPAEFNPDDDGTYEMIFTGLLNFTVPIQTNFLFDTIGGPDDVCTLVP